jgi:hypothetical protein
VIIVTLGTYSMWHGLSLVENKSSGVVPPDVNGSYFRTVQYKVGQVPVLAIIFIGLAIILQIVFQRTRFGFGSGDRQQPGSRLPRGHPARPDAHPRAGDGGCRLRPVGRPLRGPVRRDRHQLGKRVPARRRRRRDHRRDPSPVAAAP